MYNFWDGSGKINPKSWPARFANDPNYRKQAEAAEKILAQHNPRNLMLEIDAGEAKARIIDTNNQDKTLINPITNKPLEMDIVLPLNNLYLNRTDANGKVPIEHAALIDSIDPFPKDNAPGKLGWDPMAVAISLFPTAGARDRNGRDVGSFYNDGSPFKGVPYSAFHGWGGSLAGAVAKQNNGGTGESNGCWRAVDNPMALLFGLILGNESRFRIVHNRFKTFVKKAANNVSKIMLRSNPYRPYKNVFTIDRSTPQGTPPVRTELPKWDLAKLKGWLAKQFSGKNIQLNEANLNKALTSKRNETLEVGTIKE